MEDKITFGYPLPLRFIADLCSISVAKQFECVEVKSLSPVSEASFTDVCVIENEKDLRKLELSRAAACIVPRQLKLKVPAGIIPLVADNPLNTKNILSFMF